MKIIEAILIFATLLVIQCEGQQEYHPNKMIDEWSPWRPPWWNYDNSVVVRTVYGDVRGFSVPWHIDDLDWDPDWEEHPPWYTRRVNCFLGVPYAAPPIGKLRFDRPRKPRWGGLHWDATYYRPACPQSLEEIHRDIPEFPAKNVSEDCLYMNVYAPNVTYYLGTGQLYPVLVWIHSGDFSYGSAQVHPGQVLATRGVVVVTFNFRLGALGFLSLQDEQASGNWGLFDQHMALEFVRENIKAFQGDPDRITLAGDGAGAASVGLHLVSEITRNKGFFHQCIMMSGTDLAKWAFLDPYWQPRDYALQLAERLGCPTQDTYRTMLCMRDNITNPWQKILNESLLMKPKDGGLGTIWAPTQDGGWFVEHPLVPQQPYLRYTPWDMRMQGFWDKNVPCIIGLNTQDGTKVANETEPSLSLGITREDFRAYVIEMLRHWGIQDMYLERAFEAIEFQYTYWPEPENRTARTQEFIHMITDLNIGSPMDEVLRLQSNYSPQWMYQFNYKSWNDWLPNWMGVSYSAAVPYVFGVPFMNETILNETELVARQYYDYEDRNMSDWMMYMWTNFIREGHPTPNITRNITWDAQNAWNLTYLVVDWHSYIWFMYRQNKYSFWREYFPVTAKQDFYYATPTPAGYGYVVATGWMSALVIVLLACLGFMVFMIWFKDDLDRMKQDYPEHSIPLSLRSRSVQRPPPSEKSDPSNINLPMGWQSGSTLGSNTQVPTGWTTGTSSSRQVPRGWTMGSDSSQQVPRGWTMGSQGVPKGWQPGATSTQSIPTGHQASGYNIAPRWSQGSAYSNNDFSDNDEKQWNPTEVSSGPDPYSTLDYRPEVPSRTRVPSRPSVPSTQYQPSVPGHQRDSPRTIQIRPGDNRGSQQPQQRSTNVRMPYTSHSVV